MLGGNKKRGRSNDQGRIQGYSEDEAVDETPTRGSLQKLHLSLEGTWFGHPNVSHIVVESIKVNYHSFWPSWRLTPTIVKEQWFNYFKDRVAYSEEDATEVKTGFYQCCQAHLKDMIYYVDHKQKPEWMTEEIFKQLQDIRKDVNFTEKSKAAKSNSSKNMKDGKILGTHDVVEQAERMARTSQDGNVPPPFESCIPVHTKKRKIASKKALSVVDKFNATKAQPEETGAEFNENEPFFNCVSRRMKRTVDDVSSVADKHFRSCNSASRGSSMATPYDPVILGEIQIQNEILREKNKMLKENDVWLKMQNERLLKIENDFCQKYEEMLQSLTTICNNVIPLPRD